MVIDLSVETDNGLDEVSEDGLSIPTKAQFGSLDFRDGEMIQRIADMLINKYDIFGGFDVNDIDFLWKRKGGNSLRCGQIAKLIVSSKLVDYYGSRGLVLWVNADLARSRMMDVEQLAPVVFHQLCHVGKKRNGDWMVKPHVFDGFPAELEAFGYWSQALQSMAAVMTQERLPGV